MCVILIKMKKMTPGGAGGTVEGGATEHRSLSSPVPSCSFTLAFPYTQVPPGATLPLKPTEDGLPPHPKRVEIQALPWASVSCRYSFYSLLIHIGPIQGLSFTFCFQGEVGKIQSILGSSGVMEGIAVHGTQQTPHIGVVII